jgi:hypothetical protein
VPSSIIPILVCRGTSAAISVDIEPVHRGPEPVFLRHLFLEGFDLWFLEFEDHPAFLAHQMVVMGHEVTLIPLQPVPEIKFFYVFKPGKKFHRSVNRRISHGTVPLSNGVGEFFHGNVRSCPEKGFHHLCPAFASLPADCRNFCVDSL